MNFSQILCKTDEYILNRQTIYEAVVYELKILLKKIPIEKYFIDKEDIEFLKNYCFYSVPIEDYLTKKIDDENNSAFKLLGLAVIDGALICRFSGDPVEDTKFLLNSVQSYYEENAVHITRMFGSYVLLAGSVADDLRTVRATDIPIKYCPLMFKLLKEVGGETAGRLIDAMQKEDKKHQSGILCQLINEVVIKGGYFDTNRPLNSCEANVMFGASETISSAFSDGLVDAAVIVSNNLGTIITTNAANTQGAVKRMTGLFYTSPSKKIMQTAYEAGIIPIFPNTAEIDQIAGVRKAIELGYKKIAVTLAASDNILLTQLHQIEHENKVTLFKFGLCSTGISEEAAIAMKDNADIVWSCASKQIKTYIEPYSVAQVGVKIPVHIMTDQGWYIVKCHLKHMIEDVDFDAITLTTEKDKPVFLNDGDTIKVITKTELKKCDDCPYPCI